MFIYKLTNTKNNKIYIGLTTETIEERHRKKIAEAKYRKERNSYILNAIRKHGESSFVLEQIDTANTLEELKEKEIYYIKFYNSRDRNIGYNLTEGGEGTVGVLKSEETRDKIRQKALGRTRSKESKDRQKETLKSGNYSFESGKLNCLKHNLETSKIVQKLDLEGNVLKEYSSISEAYKDNSIGRTTIHRYLKKGIKYKFK